jgi:hypothetical protein
MDIIEILMMGIVFCAFLFVLNALYRTDIKRYLTIRKKCLETQGEVVAMEKDSEAESFWLNIEFKTINQTKINEKYYAAFEKNNEFSSIGAIIPIFYNPDYPKLFIAAKNLTTFKISMYFGVGIIMFIFLALFIGLHYYYHFIATLVAQG